MLSRFRVYFEKTKKDFIISIVCVSFEAAFELIIPMIMANIIDVGVATRDQG